MMGSLLVPWGVMTQKCPTSVIPIRGHTHGSIQTELSADTTWATGERCHHLGHTSVKNDARGQPCQLLLGLLHAGSNYALADGKLCTCTEIKSTGKQQGTKTINFQFFTKLLKKSVRQ